MSIKGSTVLIKEYQESIILNQEDSIITISNINDINIMLDTLDRLKNRYYAKVGINVYVNSQ